MMQYSTQQQLKNYYSNQQNGNEEHGDYFTNFCCNLECLKPLSPDCIDSHIKFHLKQGGIPQIESLRSVKANCSKKIQSAIAGLRKEVESQDLAHLLEPERMLEEGIERIRTHKLQVQSYINNYFDELEENYRHRINENLVKAQSIHSVFEKVNNIIEELSYLHEEIDFNQQSDEQQIKLIKKVCLLDLRKLLDKSRDELIQHSQNHFIDSFKIMSDENRLEFLRNELRKFCFIHVEKNDQEIQNHELSQPSNDGYNFYDRNLNQISKITDISSFKVQLPDTNGDPCLQFFEHNSKNLHIFHVRDVAQNTVPKFETIELNIDFIIPRFSKSLTTNTGDVFLTGGSLGGKQKSDIIYKLHRRDQNLEKIGKMKIGRSSHAICFMKPYIVIVGGFSGPQQMIDQCEKFNTLTNEISDMGKLNVATVSSCVCSFNGKYLFKFGGTTDGYKLAQVIEKYDFETNIWTVLNPKIHLRDSNQDFRLLQNASCQQINENNIIVFGGYYDDDRNSAQCFLFQVQDDNLNDNQQFTIKIFDLTFLLSKIIFYQDINQHLLPYAEGFWNKVPIIYEQKLYVLQNVQDNDGKDCVEWERRILQFDENGWKAIN